MLLAISGTIVVVVVLTNFVSLLLAALAKTKISTYEQLSLKLSPFRIE